MDNFFFYHLNDRFSNGLKTNKLRPEKKNINKQKTIGR